MRHIQACGLKLHNIVNSDVIVTEAQGDVILEGQLTDVNSAINNIKDVVDKSFRGTFESSNHVNGAATGTVVRRSDKPNGVAAESDLTAIKQRLASFKMDTDRMPADYRHRSLENSHSDTASASMEVYKSRVEIDQHIWHYIEFKYPDIYKHWEQKLETRQNSSAQVIEIIGEQQDVVNFCEWFKKHDLISVTRRIIEISSSTDVQHLKILLGSSEAADFGVRVRLVDRTAVDCIGKTSDIDGFISWLRVALRDFREHAVTESSADVEHTARVNGSMSTLGGSNTDGNDSAFHTSGPGASTTRVTSKKPFILHADHERLKFRTVESQLEVEVLVGDLTRQKTEVIVNPANRLLRHNGGAARAIKIAAGNELVNECKDYMRTHKELPTSQVMHTTSGKLPRPINYVIHACGPNARDYPDDKQCLHLLEKTFLNCFTHANDKLQARSLALPAISSGTLVLK